MEFLTPVLDTVDKKTPRRTSGPFRRGDGQPPAPGQQLDLRLPPREGVRRNRPVFAVMVCLALLVACSLSAPLLSPHAVNQVSLDTQISAPSGLHPFGTDDLGRDFLVRVLYGGRATLFVGLLAVAFALVIGLAAGTASGYFGGWIDGVIMRAADLMHAVPIFFVVLLLSSVLSPTLLVLGLLIAFTQWVEIARVVRSVVLTTRENTYVEAARALGVSDLRIMIRHVLPHTGGPVLVAGTLGLAHAIMMESALSFLGFGVPPPIPSWGGMLQDAQTHLGTAPWLAIFPGVLIFLAVFCCFVMGESLRSHMGSKAS